MCNNLNNWIDEDKVQKLFQNEYKGNRLAKGSDILQSLKQLLDQDLKLVKEHLFKYFTRNYNDNDNSNIMIKDNLIRTPNDNVPIHINCDVDLPITVH